MKAWKPLYALLLTVALLSACGDVADTEPVSAKASAISVLACTGPTPNYYVDVYSLPRFDTTLGTCKRLPPYSYVPDAIPSFLAMSSFKLGARAELHTYSLPGPAGTSFTWGPSYQAMSVSGIIGQTVRAFSLYPTSMGPNNGIPRHCDSATVVPGPHEMVLFNGWNFSGVCSIFETDGLNYAYFPDMSVFGWDTWQSPIASIKMGSAINATIFNKRNFDSGGAPPGALLAGWNFNQSFSFLSMYAL